MRNGDIEAADVPPAEKKLLEFAKTLTLTPAMVSDEQIAELRESGWTGPQIAEAVYDIALFALFNRVADAFGLEDPRSQYNQLLNKDEN